MSEGLERWLSSVTLGEATMSQSGTRWVEGHERDDRVYGVALHGPELLQTPELFQG